MNKHLSVIAAVAFGAALVSSAQAASYKVVEVTNGGVITGKVTFKGKDPDPIVYAVTKNLETCGKDDRLLDYVKVNNGALTNVVVYLSKVKQGKPFADGTAAIKVNQQGCAFDPFLQVMANGGKIAVLNSDPVSHNIHTYEMLGRAKKTVFNISQPDQNSLITKTVKLKRGSAMKVECDQHDFMHGFVFVAKNPYYAVVAEDGSYRIENVPQGKYKIRAWHGTLKEQKGSVTIAGGDAATVNFEFKGK